MKDDNKLTVAQDQHGKSPDPPLPLVAIAFANRVLKPFPNASMLDDSERYLTETERKRALEESHEDFATRILARWRASRDEKTRDETRIKSQDSTHWEAAGQSRIDSAAEELSSDEGRSNKERSNQERRMKLFADQASFENVKMLDFRSQYEKTSELGRGGQGVVYLARCVEDHGESALKVFSPEPYSDADSYQQDMKRLAEVARVVRSIHHDNLLYVERFTNYRDIWVMWMQWIEGRDLRRLVQPGQWDRLNAYLPDHRRRHLNNVVYGKRGPGHMCLRPGMAVNIIEKCLRAIGALHSKGIVHGDIKPANIMLDRFGSIKLIDIGSASRMEDPPMQHTWTPRYAAPEFIETGEWLPESDQASLGYVLIELLGGRPVIDIPEASDQSTRSIDRASKRALLEEKRQLPERLPELLPEEALQSEHLVNLCRRLIDPDPGKRFQNAWLAIEQKDGTAVFANMLAKMNLMAPFTIEIQKWVDDTLKCAS